MKKQISYKIVSLVFAILVLCFAVGFYIFAWVEPSGEAPTGNVPAPLNTSYIEQIKVGGLILNTGGAEVGLAVDQGKVGIGTLMPTEALDLGSGNLTTTGRVHGNELTDGVLSIFGGQIFNGNSAIFSNGIGQVNICSDTTNGIAIDTRQYNKNSLNIGGGGLIVDKNGNITAGEGTFSGLTFWLANAGTIFFDEISNIHSDDYDLVIQAANDLILDTSYGPGSVKMQQLTISDGDIVFEKSGSPLWRIYENAGEFYAENLSTGKTYRFLVEEITP